MREFFPSLSTWPRLPTSLHEDIITIAIIEHQHLSDDIGFLSNSSHLSAHLPHFQQLSPPCQWLPPADPQTSVPHLQLGCPDCSAESPRPNGNCQCYSLLCMHAYSSRFSLCPTLCEPTDCSPPGSSVHGILQARVLEWVAMPTFRGSSQPRDRTLCLLCLQHR